MADDQVCRATESKQEKFPIVPCLRSFVLVRGYLNAINYDGPVGLSCDDSKLFPAFRPYFDSKEDAYYVVGCTGTPLRIADIEEFNVQLEQGLLVKAAKVSPPRLVLIETNTHHSPSFDFGVFKSHYQMSRQQSSPLEPSPIVSQRTYSWSTNSR